MTDAIFSVDDAALIAAGMRRLGAMIGNPTPQRPTNARTMGARVEGILLDAVTPSTNDGKSPTTARMTCYRGEGRAWSTGEVVILTNRDDDLSVPAGSFQIAVEINGELRPIPTGSATLGSGTSSGGCCCDESRCLKIPGITTPLVPLYYEINIASTFLCGCVQDGTVAHPENGKIKLYQTDADPAVWESVKIQCYYSGQNEDCTNEATWVWTLITPPCGTASYTWNGFQWNMILSPPNTCVSPCSPVDPDDIPDGTTPGETKTLPCAGATPVYGWELQSVSNEDCDCTPDEPDYEPDWDGIGDPPTATTTCEGSNVSADAVLVDTWWRLTIGDLDENGCDTTKLELLQDDPP